MNYLRLHYKSPGVLTTPSAFIKRSKMKPQPTLTQSGCDFVCQVTPTNTSEEKKYSDHLIIVTVKKSCNKKVNL